MEIFSHPTIVLSILEHLPPISYLVLRQALPLFIRRSRDFPDLYSFTVKRAQEYISSYFQDDPELARNIIELLDNDRLGLTGGFLLSILQGDFLVESQDMDFFYVCTEDELNNIQDEQYDLPTFIFARYSSLFIEKLSTIGTYPPLGSGSVCLTSYYFTNNRKIQLIHCSHDYFKRNLGHFDFSFCKNLLNSRFKLVVMYPSSVLFRKTQVAIADCVKNIKLEDSGKVEGFIHARILRINKYVERDYQIDIIYNPNETYSEFYSMHVNAYSYPKQLFCDVNCDWSKHSKKCRENFIRKERIQKTVEMSRLIHAQCRTYLYQVPVGCFVTGIQLFKMPDGYWSFPGIICHKCGTKQPDRFALLQGKWLEDIPLYYQTTIPICSLCLNRFSFAGRVSILGSPFQLTGSVMN